MKDKFFQYHPLNEDQIEKLWEQSIFVFDTNVLFNLYRYSEQTSDEFLQTISKLKKRIWLPNHVACEFYRKRLSVIEDEINTYKDFNKKIDSIYADLENRNRNPYFSQELQKEFSNVKIKINQEIEEKIKEFEKKYIADNILQKVIEIFDKQVGEEFSNDKLNTIYKDGEIRYKDDMPPGFEDKKKPSPDKYGDLVIWHQIIEKSKEEKKPIIFITDDGKEDWWLIHSGKIISPRPELLKEFKSQTNQICHFYKPFQFLKYSNTFLGNDVKLEVIQEVKNLEKIEVNSTKRILVIIKVKCLQKDLNSLTDIISNDGYNISFSEIKEGFHSLFIVLPNIEDLERRFKKKYLAELQNLNMELIEYSTKLLD